MLFRSPDLVALEGDDLAPDGARHIGHVDDADDDDWQEQTSGGDGDGADGQALRDQDD